MNKNLLIVLAVILAAVVGLFLFTQSGMPAGYNQAPQNTTGDNSATVVLNELNDSGESGTATLVELEQDGKVVVTLSVTGAPAGVVQTSHIHSGDCANTGAVVSLEFPTNGKVVTTLPVSLSELKAQLPLLIQNSPYR